MPLPHVIFDSTIRISDLVMILALLVGPIAAVWINDIRQARHQKRGQKEWVFRTLMTTRAAPHAASHIDALNLAGLLFTATKHNEPNVLDSWKIYIGHLQKLPTPEDWWAQERVKLLSDLLYEMAVALNYSFNRSEIKNTTSYYPRWYETADSENSETRKLWLEILQHKRALPTTDKLSPPQPPRPKQMQEQNQEKPVAPSTPVRTAS